MRYENDVNRIMGLLNRKIYREFKRINYRKNGANKKSRHSKNIQENNNEFQKRLEKDRKSFITNRPDIDQVDELKRTSLFNAVLENGLNDMLKK